MKGKKISFHLSVFGLSVSILAASTVSLFPKPTAAVAQQSARRPTIATVKSMVNGDIMCYVTLVGDNGTVYKSVGADFDICGKGKTYLHRRVRLSYQKVRVNDCQSADPCGRTKEETLITKMQVIAR